VINPNVSILTWFATGYAFPISLARDSVSAAGEVGGLDAIARGTEIYDDRMPLSAESEMEAETRTRAVGRRVGDGPGTATCGRLANGLRWSDDIRFLGGTSACEHFEIQTRKAPSSPASLCCV
jgi:hypothetical protein